MNDIVYGRNSTVSAYNEDQYETLFFLFLLRVKLTFGALVNTATTKLASGKMNICKTRTNNKSATKIVSLHL